MRLKQEIKLQGGKFPEKDGDRSYERRQGRVHMFYYLYIPSLHRLYSTNFAALFWRTKKLSFYNFFITVSIHAPHFTTKYKLCNKMCALKSEK